MPRKKRRKGLRARAKQQKLYHRYAREKPCDSTENEVEGSDTPDRPDGPYDSTLPDNPSVLEESLLENEVNENSTPKSHSHEDAIDHTVGPNANRKNDKQRNHDTPEKPSAIEESKVLKEIHSFGSDEKSSQDDSLTELQNMFKSDRLKAYFKDQLHNMKRKQQLSSSSTDRFKRNDDAYDGLQQRRKQKLNDIRKRRSDQAFRENERNQDRMSRPEKRCDAVSKKIEADRNTVARKSKRTHSEVRKKEASRETPARKKKREDSEVRSQEASRDTSARKKKREDSEVRKKEASRETTSRKKKREYSEVRKKEALRETRGRKGKRTDPEVRLKEAKQNMMSKRYRRADHSVREREAAREKESKREKRKIPSNVLEAIRIFREKISEGPSFYCISCCLFMYRKSVTEFNLTKLPPTTSDILKLEASAETNQKYICSSCKSSLKKKEILYYRNQTIWVLMNVHLCYRI